MSIGLGLSDAEFDRLTDFVSALKCPTCGVTGDVEIDARREHRKCRGCGHVFTQLEWDAAGASARSTK